MENDKLKKIIKTTIREFINENTNKFDEDDVEKWMGNVFLLLLL